MTKISKLVVLCGEEKYYADKSFNFAAKNLRHNVRSKENDEFYAYSYPNTDCYRIKTLQIC